MKDNEIKTAGGNGVSMDTSKTMYGGTNESLPQGDPKAKSLNGDGVTSWAKTMNESANVSKLDSMDKSGFRSTSTPL